MMWLLLRCGLSSEIDQLTNPIGVELSSEEEKLIDQRTSLSIKWEVRILPTREKIRSDIESQGECDEYLEAGRRSSGFKFAQGNRREPDRVSQLFLSKPRCPTSSLELAAEPLRNQLSLVAEFHP